MARKRYLYLTHDEWVLLIKSLNEFRTQIIHEGGYTDAVDDVLYKTINAKEKKVKFV